MAETERRVRQLGGRGRSGDSRPHRSSSRASGRPDVIEQWGGVDILVNAAGGGAVSYFHEMSYETWITQIDRNLNSVFNVTRAVLPSMLTQQSGRVISIASVAAISGGRNGQGCDRLRGGQGGPGRPDEIAGDRGRRARHHVNRPAPGAQDTPGRAKDSPERRKALPDQIPTRRPGRPSDLAQAVVFLAAPEAVNITGVVLPLDGGHSI